MQFCDLEDLYKKFNVVKMLRIGRTERPRFNYSGDFSFPESESFFLSHVHFVEVTFSTKDQSYLMKKETRFLLIMKHRRLNSLEKMQFIHSTQIWLIRVSTLQNLRVKLFFCSCFIIER